MRSIEAALGGRGLVVMDEIGRMELFSEKFQEAVIRALDSPRRVFGVIQMRRNHFLDAVRRRTDTQVVAVTLENRDALLSEIAALLNGP